MSLTIHIKVFSQLTVAPRLLSSNSYNSIDDLWDLTITNNTQLSYVNNTLVLKLSNDKGQQIEATGMGLNINAGNTFNINKGSLKNSQTTFLNKDYKALYDSIQILPGGNYTICYTILTEKDSISLCNYCQAFRIENILDKKLKKNDLINSTGFIQFAGFYAFGSDSLPRNPANYFVARGNPTIELFDIPLKADYQFNIINGQLDPLTTYFNFSFDGNRFRQNLKTKGEKYIKDQTKDFDKYKATYQKAKNELGKLNDILNNPAVQKEMLLTKLRDSLEQVIKAKLQPYSDSIAKIKANSVGNIDSLKKTGTDSLSRLSSTVSGLADSLSIPKNQYSADSLIAKLYSDSTFIKTYRGIDSLKAIVNKYKALDYLKYKAVAYDELLKKKERLKVLMAKADSLQKVSPTSLVVDKMPGISRVYEILSKVNTLSWGTHINTVSEFACYAMPLNGFNLQTTNDGVFVQYTNAQQVPMPLSNTNKYFTRHHSIYGIGYGKDKKWHIKLLYLAAADKNAIKQLPQDSIDFYGPSANRVISVLGKLSIAKFLTFETELAGSETVKNKLAYSIVTGDLNTVNPFYNPTQGQSWSNIVTRNNTDINRYVGYAVKAALVANIESSRTKITAGVKRTGRDFNTYANPMLFRNALVTDFKITQNLYRNNIKLSGIFKYNNFFKDSSNTTLKSLYQYGADLSVNFKKYPSLRALYLPTQQLINNQLLLLNTVNIISTYDYTLLHKRNIISCSALLQNTVKTTINAFNLNTANISVSNITQLTKNLSVNLRYSYNSIKLYAYANKLNCFEVSTSLYITKAKLTINNSFLFTTATNSRRLGGTVEILHTINEIFSLSVRAERNTYNNFYNNSFVPIQYAFPSYSEWLGYASFNIKW